MYPSVDQLNNNQVINTIFYNTKESTLLLSPVHETKYAESGIHYELEPIARSKINNHCFLYFQGLCFSVGKRLYTLCSTFAFPAVHSDGGRSVFVIEQSV